MKWNDTLPKEKKPKIMTSAIKTTWAVFWHDEGCIMFDFCHKGKSTMLLDSVRRSRIFVVNCMTYIKRRKQSSCNMTMYSWTSIVSEWAQFRRMVELLPCLPHSLDLTPVDYNLFRFIKGQMWGQNSATNEATQDAVHFCLKTAQMELCPKQNL